MGYAVDWKKTAQRVAQELREDASDAAGSDASTHTPATSTDPDRNSQTEGREMIVYENDEAWVTTDGEPSEPGNFIFAVFCKRTGHLLTTLESASRSTALAEAIRFANSIDPYTR